MACGKLIVASDTKVVREIMDDSECMLVVSPNEADSLAQGILSLIEDKEKRKKMGIREWEHVVRNFDRTKLAENLILISQKILLNYYP